MSWEHLDAYTHEYVNKIPLDNIWWLLLYDDLKHQHQFDTLRSFTTENFNQEQLPLLLLKLFTQAIQERLSAGLTRSYMEHRTVSSLVRGKINLTSTHKKQLLQQGKVAIQYEHFHADTPTNQLIRTALHHLLQVISYRTSHTTHTALIAQAKQCQNRLIQLHISVKPVVMMQQISIKISQHNQHDAQIINLAKLALRLSQFMHDTGLMSHQKIYTIKLDAKYIYHIYERALRNFFRYHLPHLQVNTGNTKIAWQISSSIPYTHSILPQMWCDILIADEEFSLIIDTKFTPMLPLKSSHLYQINTYVQHYGASAGLLLYPSVQSLLTTPEPVIEILPLGDKLFFVAEFSLTQASYARLEKQLLSIIEKIWAIITSATS